MKRIRLAKLTKLENAAWVKYFLYYLDDGKSTGAADEAAWQDIAAEFPRLQKYDGCEA